MFGPPSTDEFGRTWVLVFDGRDSSDRRPPFPVYIMGTAAALK